MSQVPFTEEEVKSFSSGLGVQVPDGCIIVGNSSGAGACVALSGHATISNAGVITIPSANGLSDVTSAGMETSSTNAGAISVTKQITLITSAGAESRTLAAPAAAGQRKLIFFKTDGGDVTLAGTNIYGQTSATATFNDAGDVLELFSFDAVKWSVIGGSGVAFA